MQSSCSQARFTTISGNPGGGSRVPLCMNIPIQNLAAPAPGDEIAELAGRYLLLPEAEGLARIDAEVLRATDESRWDDVSKWHRVRFRLIRLHQQRMLDSR